MTGSKPLLSRAPHAASGSAGVGPWAAFRALGSTAESRLVGFTAFVMGMALVTFPAAAGVIMGTRDYSLSGIQYGELVLPEVAASILAALTGFGLGRRHATRLAYRIGIAFSLLSMVLLLATAPFESAHSLTFPILLAAGACLGAGFGLVIPVLMSYARFLHATNEDPSVLALNGLLALGAIIAPAIAVGFARLDWWWGLPALVGVMHVVQLLLSGHLPTYVGAAPGPAAQSRKRTLRFLLYAVSAMLYAITAAIIVVWCQIKVTSPPTTAIHAQLTAAIRPAADPHALSTSLALAALWGGLLVAARVLFAAADRWLAGRWRVACYFVPVILFGTLTAVGVISSIHELAVVAVFGLAIVGCSALLPLRMSFNHWDVVAITAALAGGIAAYQLAYGFMADGLRPGPGAGLGVAPIFAIAGAVGVVMAIMSMVAIRHQPARPAEAKTPGRPR